MYARLYGNTITPHTVPMTKYEVPLELQTPRQDRHICRQHINNIFTRTKQRARQAIGNHQIPISDGTVRRRLIVNNIECRPPDIWRIFTVRHRQERLQWTM